MSIRRALLGAAAFVLGAAAFPLTTSVGGISAQVAPDFIEAGEHFTSNEALEADGNDTWQSIAVAHGMTGSGSGTDSTPSTAGDWLQRFNRVTVSTSDSALVGVGAKVDLPIHAGAPASPPASTTTTQPPTTTVAPTTTNATTTTAGPTTTAAPTTTTTTPPVTGRASPGTVGFLGNEASLPVINSAATAPAGSTWMGSYLEVTATNFTLDGVLVDGGVDFHGSGTLIIRNSVIKPRSTTSVTVIGRVGGSTMDIRNSDIRGNTTDVGAGQGAIQIQADLRVVAIANDISGTPDGLQIAGPNNLIERNWVHDLTRIGTYPNNTHNDGLQMYSGDAVIRGNYFDVGAVQPYSNSCLFFQGSAIQSVTTDNNYLSGGGYSFYAENGQHTVTNNTFGPDYLWGTHAVVPPASAVAWSGNVG